MPSPLPDQGSQDEELSDSFLEMSAYAKLTQAQAKQVLAYVAQLKEQLLDEGEQRAARKIQAVINAHKGLNSESDVLALVESSLQVLPQLEAEAALNAIRKGEK